MMSVKSFSTKLIKMAVIWVWKMCVCMRDDRWWWKVSHFHRPPMLETAAATKTYHNQIVRVGKNNQNFFIPFFPSLENWFISIFSLTIEHKYCSSKLAVIEEFEIFTTNSQIWRQNSSSSIHSLAHVHHINFHQNTFHLICHHSACFINQIHQFSFFQKKRRRLCKRQWSEIEIV